jgi:hypothetical protein
MDLTKQQIDAHRAKHGELFRYTTTDGKSCLLKTPDLMTLDACRTIAAGSSIKFDKALIDNCWVDGDVELKTEDKYLMGLFEWTQALIIKVDGTLEKL